MKPTKEEISKTPSVLNMLEVIQEKVGDYGYYGATDWELTPSPVIIGDVLEYTDKNIFKKEGENLKLFKERYEKIELKILEKWEDKRSSINYQSFELIEYIYNLVK